MAAKDTQISAYISKEINKRIDLFVRETGIKKGRVIEDALEAHLDALEQLPPDVIIPTRMTLTKESFERLVDRLEADPAPTPELIKLVRGRG